MNYSAYLDIYDNDKNTDKTKDSVRSTINNMDNG